MLLIHYSEVNRQKCASGFVHSVCLKYPALCFAYVSLYVLINHLILKLEIKITNVTDKFII